MDFVLIRYKISHLLAEGSRNSKNSPKVGLGARLSMDYILMSTNRFILCTTLL